MRLKFHSYEFNIQGSLKTVFIPFFEIKKIFFNNLRTNIIKIIPIKFHSK